ncbi:MAG TPA: SMI1/KNR4 family protein [Chitinophaga sp.]|uniref:SMI1/KNR4 family protein n=1 Tax=Chitinophaga sp. TaxID=1869181 RepID=UPI002DB9E7E3|nr:SMI1/KNR4 family protein [Chitinophaga sp.]HEU4554193.1 SMI1/KNR4 family protein [Chitinophaga sp.]
MYEKNRLVVLLEQLLTTLKSINSPLVELLQPGIDRNHVDELLGRNEIDIALAEEVYTLYGWRNGASSHELHGNIELFGGGIFFPLQLGLESYEYYAIQKNHWPKGLFPLFETGGGEYYLIDCREDAVSYGMLYFFSYANPYINGIITYCDSLENLIKATIECYNKHLYPKSFEPERTLMYAKEEAEANVFKVYNPKSEYWRQW